MQHDRPLDPDPGSSGLCSFKHPVLLLRAGIQQGEFRADLDPEIGASILMTFILGLGTSLFMPVPGGAEQMIQHIERWLTG